MDNLFLARSPFQILNAIEANEYFRESSGTLVVKLSDNRNNNQQLLRMLDVYRWPDVHVLGFHPILRGNFPNFLRRLLHLRERRFDKVFIGDFRNQWMHIVTANVRKNAVFLLDDGMSSLNIQDDLANHRPNSFRPRRLKRLLLAGFGLALEREEKYNFFTCLEMTPIDGQAIVRNDFSYLKSIVGTKVQNQDVVYFFGSPLVHDKMVSETHFLRFLSQIKTHYSSKLVIYIPHRREDPDSIEKVRRYFPVEQLAYPAEVEFLFREQTPRHIAAFFSTVLFTLSQSYPNIDAEAFRIPDRVIAPQHRQNIRSFYDYHRKHVRIVELDIDP